MVYDLSRIERLKRQKEFEEDRDIEWQEIADAAHISLSTLARYRANTVGRPQKTILMAICNYFDVSVEFFVAGDDQGEEDSPGNQTGHPYCLGSPSTLSIASIG
ncbi:helix-turn-helix domain-containing protein [Chloroflexota bacterium]